MRNSFLNKVKPLIRIKAGGNKIPLYIICPIGETILCLRNLVSLLDDEQPVYGLHEPLGPDDLNMIFNNIEDISIEYFERTAAKYIAEILDQNPCGPYALAGYSFGGFIAFEMAKQMEAMGKRVKMIALFDTMVEKIAGTEAETCKKPNHMNTSIRQTVFAIQLFSYYMSLLFVYRTYFIKTLITKIKRKIKKPSISVESAKLRALTAARDRLSVMLYKNYRIKPYNGNIVLFRARRRNFSIDDHKYLGWKPYSKSIKIYNIDGNHYSIFNSKYCKRFGKLLQRALDNCDVE